MAYVIETSDAAAGTSTTYSMNVGDIFLGNNSGGESDWIAINLVAGQTYTFAQVGTGALSTGISDPYLVLHNSSGLQVAGGLNGDDDGPGANSSFTFTAAYTGTYYLNASDYPGAPFETGSYAVSVVEGNRAGYDVIMGAGVLVRSDTSWSGTAGAGTVVTWAARASGPAYDAQGNPVTFQGLSSAQLAAVQSALAMYSDVSGLTFTQVNPGGTSNNATMLFGAYSSSADGSGAYAYYPGSTASSSNAGDVWLNNNSVSQTSLPAGSFSLFAIIHEIGHAVGLSHPGDYNAAPGVSILYSTHAQFTQDSHQYTVMSYFDESNTTSSYGSYPDTLMLFDIYALQLLYGANMSTRSGDSIYGFGTNLGAGSIYDFSSNTSPTMSIWDGGGTDTLDVSGFSQNQVINLNEGAFSNIGGLTGNISIAYGAVIENAVGGSGNDTFYGNSANNALFGGSGTDTAVVGSASSAWDIVRFGDVVQLFSKSTSEHDWHDSIEILDFTDTNLTLSGIADNDPYSYLATYGDLLAAFGTDTDAAILHYFVNGHAEGRILDGFDEWSYLASYGDLLNAFGTDGAAATMHYVYDGYREGRATDLFDEWSYLASYGDLIEAFGANGAAATLHYVYNGYSEGRATDLFDEWSYLASYSDLIEAFGADGAAATLHYVYDGYREGRATDLFDEWSYLASYADLIEAFGADGAAATKHYVYNGYSEGRAKDLFDEFRYLASYGDLIEAFGADGAAATLHYVVNGYKEGRVADFDAQQYLDNYADLQAAFGSDLAAATLHFIEYGYFEGRTDEVVV